MGFNEPMRWNPFPRSPWLVLFVGLLSLAFHGWAQPASPQSPAAALKPFVDKQALAGAVTLVGTGDRLFSLDAVGFADVAESKPMAVDALFWIASQTKPMTTAALMMLVDEGKVNVEDPVEKYLPEFRGQMLVVAKDSDHMLLRKPTHPIRVREILSHTSGLPFKSPIEEPTLDQLLLRVAVRSYAMVPLEFDPGSKYQYSNAGINTAGRIIEVIGGMAYEEFMQQRLFRPLAMTNTTFWPDENQVRRLAKSYKPKAGQNGLEEITITQLQYPLSDRKRQPMPAGGLFSTASDVARFCQMVLNGGVFEGKRYLTESAVQTMTSKQTGNAVKDEYGFGWSIGSGTFGHGGAYATHMDIDRRTGLITVFLVQHAGFPGEEGNAIQEAFRKAAQSYSFVR
jgi:CubicO group peptidase (beta-lactamase class C family)